MELNFGILKADEFKYIPSIILTTSNNRKMFWNATELNCGLLKPLKYDDYVSRIKALIEY
jgi:hypothetical protein